MGESLSLLTALVWAVAMVLFKRSGESVPPFALNLFRVTISSALFLATIPFVSLERQLTPGDLAALAASGIIGIAISDTLFHRGLNLMGASITGIVDCLYSPFVALFALLMLDESMTTLQWLGMGLVIGAVLLATITRSDSAGTRTRPDLLWGIFYGTAAMTTVALGVVLAKPVLAHTNLIWATAIRQFFALTVLLPATLILKDRRAILSVLTWGPHWRFALPATILGSYLALMLWLAGMKYSRAGVAAVLNQTSTIWVLLLAAWFLGERFTKRKVAATILALAGIALVIS
jgi:drug/metabolite transporter (DMT)-like permease